MVGGSENIVHMLSNYKCFSASSLVSLHAGTKQQVAAFIKNLEEDESDLEDGVEDNKGVEEGEGVREQAPKAKKRKKAAPMQPIDKDVKVCSTIFHCLTDGHTQQKKILCKI